MKSLTLSIALAGMMTLTAAAGMVTRPASKPAGTAPKYLLEDIVPVQFGDWKVLPDSGAQVVNPQTKELLDKLYSQILTRTYVNSQGYRIMLSLAYGDDQRGDLQAHKPEVCYPAQGFALHSNEEAVVATPFGSIEARRLNTSHGQRKEPITYWFTVGDTAVKNRLQMRMVEIKLGLTGQIPDGLLFRVSSIDPEPQRAYQAHDTFVRDLLAQIPLRDRQRLSGLTAANPT